METLAGSSTHGGAAGLAAPDTTPPAPAPIVSRLSQCDFPSDERTVCYPVSKDRLWRREAAAEPVTPPTVTAPVLPSGALLSERISSTLIGLSMQSTLPPGLSLGSVAGARPFDDFPARAVNPRASVDAAAGAELLQTSTAEDLASKWICPPPRSSSISLDRHEYEAPSSAPGSRGPTRPTSPSEARSPRLHLLRSHYTSEPLQYDSDIQLARIVASYAALDVRREARYDPPGGSSGSSSSKKGSSAASAGCGSTGRYVPVMPHAPCDWVVGSGSCGEGAGSEKESATGMRLALRGAGGDDRQCKPGPSPSSWSFLSMLAPGRGARRASTGMVAGSGGTGPAEAYDGSRSMSGGSRRADGGIRAGWRRCQHLLWRSAGAGTEKATRSEDSKNSGHKSAGGGYPAGDCGSEAAAGADEVELPEPFLRSRDSRVVHRVRLGLDFRPPEFERSLSVFSVARDEEGQLVTRSGHARSPLLAILPASSAAPASTLAPALEDIPVASKWVWLRRKLVTRTHPARSRRGSTGSGPLRSRVSAARVSGVEELFTPICRACKHQQQRPATSERMLGTGMHGLQTATSLPLPMQTGVTGCRGTEVAEAPEARRMRCLAQPEPRVAGPIAAVGAAAGAEMYHPMQPRAAGQRSAVASVSVLVKVRSFRASSIWPVMVGPNGMERTAAMQA